MKPLILLLVAALPYYTVGHFVGGSYVNVTQLLMVVVAAFGCARIAITGYIPTSFTKSAGLSLRIFCLVMFIGVLVSPYGESPLSKAVVQSVGILIAVVVSIIVSSEIQRNPEFLFDIVRVAVKSFGIFSIVAIAQFLVWNIFRTTTFLNFEFMNDMSGGIIWRGGGSIGPLIRANSWASEPAHFTRYLGFVLSFAIARFGFIGERAKTAVLAVVPLWSAWSILIGFFVAFSILGLFQFALTAGILLFFGNKIKTSTFVSAMVVIVLGASLLGLGAMLAGSEFQSKLATVSLLLDAKSSNAATHIDTADLSALAVSTNWEVAMRNLEQDPFLGGGIGSHGIAYEHFAPNVVFLNKTLYRLNADDAAGLAARLLSEMGFLGFFSFVGVFVLTALKARSIAIKEVNSTTRSQLAVVRLCFVVSMISVLTMYLVRSGQYFDPLLYVLLGTVSSVRAAEVRGKAMPVFECAASVR